MTLTEMRYITALDKTRHFGRAADACHVSQPTLSVAIKKVEQQIGAPLFERGASEIRTTPLGELIVTQIKRVLDETLRLDEIATQSRDPLKGPLRVGVIYTIAPYLLPALIPVLHKLAPDMPLFLREDFTANLIPMLKEGELDILVLALPVDVPGIVAQRVYEEPFRVVVPAAHEWAGRKSVRNDELDGQQLLLLGSGNCFRDQVLEACPRLQRAEGLSGSIEGSSLETIRHMVASGAGIAVMPSSAADPLVDREPMVKVLPFAEASGQVARPGESAGVGRTVGLAWRTTFPRPKAVDAVRQAILSCQLPGVSKAS
ncbi:hydrogen peroxide-inducible genes activator [Fluviibacter phosphoraccumulans]|uniref:LysR family transcriptional regulator n=1 Tax=Fluviibacter phosphoraccumulans TaxID=1751046 RepID=A0A7R6QZW2_9RHOO|nr:hydrogen peroxide-inducible genes activator [Fluviibacter phosphoraccumulans]BBU68235.1 LysR family transcriptional regulator [Fluviibacter phosphoraccumulans]BBU70226.1 LysR family transcriptional regulator [Fluviibacter phosphoraccumulans]